MNNLKIGIIQSKVDKNKDINNSRAIENINTLAKKGANIIILPEMFNCPYNTSCFPKYAEYQHQKTCNLLSNISKKNNIYTVGGSIPEIDNDKIYNTSYVFNKNGKIIAKHRKAHLFDIDIENGQYFKESNTLHSGNKSTVFDTEYCKIGLCICYDFRFPELATKMVQEDAKIIVVPAAFNMTTGPAHWELLFRQRAIDNQVYTIGVASARDLNSSYISYGNSIICSPWGDVIFRADEKEQIKIIAIDLNLVTDIRKQLPLLKHKRQDIY